MPLLNSSSSLDELGYAAPEGEGMNSSELLDIVDDADYLVLRQGAPLKVPRSACHKLQLRHRSIDVLLFPEQLFDPHGYVLMEQRSLSRDRLPGRWTFVQGHVSAGEEYLSAAVRELHEEMFYGLPPPEVPLVELFKISTDGDGDPEIKMVYGGISRGPFSIQKSEVETYDFFRIDGLAMDMAARPERYTETTVNVFKEYCNHLYRNSGSMISLVR